MSVVSFKVTGLDAIQAQLLEIGAALGQKKLAAAARKAFAPVLARAAQLAPKDSGALAQSLKLTVSKPKAGDAVVVVGIYVGKAVGGLPGELPPARRWHFVEFGTVHMSAKPFFRPALDASAPQVLEILKAELIAGIQRAIRAKARAAAKAAQ